jgi:hypothetical protein
MPIWGKLTDLYSKRVVLAAMIPPREQGVRAAGTTEYGANYPKVSQAIWTAIQAAITGTKLRYKRCRRHSRP